MATPFQYTHLCKQVELQAMVEDLATLGSQAPKFSWQMPAKYVALDVNVPTDTRAGDHPVIHSTIDFRSQIKAAWPVLLDQLQQLQIPIPDITRQPILPGINDQCRNRVRPDGLEVNCWVVEFDGTEAFEKQSYEGINEYWLNKKIGAADTIPLGAGNVCIQYNPSKASSYVSMQDKDICTRGMRICIVDNSCANSAALKAHLAELKAAGTPLQVVYQLATPLFIPFEQPVNLSLGELSKYTFIGAHDINDQPMYDLQTHYEHQDKHFLLTRWNKDWVAEHKEFPMCAITTFDGIGFVADYNAVYTDHFLLQDIVTQLKNKGIIS